MRHLPGDPAAPGAALRRAAPPGHGGGPRRERCSQPGPSHRPLRGRSAPAPSRPVPSRSTHLRGRCRSGGARRVAARRGGGGGPGRAGRAGCPGSTELHVPPCLRHPAWAAGPRPAPHLPRYHPHTHRPGPARGPGAPVAAGRVPPLPLLASRPPPPALRQRRDAVSPPLKLPFFSLFFFPLFLRLPLAASVTLKPASDGAGATPLRLMATKGFLTHPPGHPGGDGLARPEEATSAGHSPKRPYGPRRLCGVAARLVCHPGGEGESHRDGAEGALVGRGGGSRAFVSGNSAGTGMPQPRVCSAQPGPRCRAARSPPFGDRCVINGSVGGKIERRKTGGWGWEGSRPGWEAGYETCGGEKKSVSRQSLRKTLICCSLRPIKCLPDDKHTRQGLESCET